MSGPVMSAAVYCEWAEGVVCPTGTTHSQLNTRTLNNVSRVACMQQKTSNIYFVISVAIQLHFATEVTKFWLFCEGNININIEKYYYNITMFCSIASISCMHVGL